MYSCQARLIKEMIEMDIKDIELEAFRQIRIKVSSMLDESNNDEIAGFVKGIVALESELYAKINK